MMEIRELSNGDLRIGGQTMDRDEARAFASRILDLAEREHGAFVVPTYLSLVLGFVTREDTGEPERVIRLTLDEHQFVFTDDAFHKLYTLSVQAMTELERPKQ